MNKRPDITAKTKADLQDAFWFFYADKPIESITIAQICQKAGYNRGTFYLHFHDIFELLESIESTLLTELTSCVEGCMKRLAADESKLARIAALRDVVLFYKKNQRYLVVLLGEKGDMAFAFRVKEALKPLWRTYVIDEESTEGRTEGEIDLILESTLMGALFMVHEWLRDPRGISSLQLGHLIYDSAIKNVG